MNTRAEAATIRAALFTSRLAAADAPVLYLELLKQMPTDEQALLLQAAEALIDNAHANGRKVPLGLGSALEVLAKIGALMVEEGIPK